MVSGVRAFHQEVQQFRQETCCPFPAAVDSCLGPEDPVVASEKGQEVVGIAREEEVAVAEVALAEEGVPMTPVFQVVRDEKDRQKDRMTCLEEAASPYLGLEGGAFAAALDFAGIDWEGEDDRTHAHLAGLVEEACHPCHRRQEEAAFLQILEAAAAAGLGSHDNRSW